MRRSKAHLNLVLAALATGALFLPAAFGQTKKKAQAPANAQAKPAKTQPKAPAKASTNKSSPAAKKGKTAPATAARRPRQLQPTQQRYREIQQALADKGYFNGEIDGNWGPSSLDSLKRFQRDQNLVEDGKLGSLSLIALGLGPQRGAFPSRPPATPAVENAPPPPEREPAQR